MTQHGEEFLNGFAIEQGHIDEEGYEIIKPSEQEQEQKKEKPTISKKSDILSENTRDYALSLTKKSDMVLYFSELQKFADEYGIDKRTFDDFKKACISDFRYSKTAKEQIQEFPDWITQTKSGITIHEPNFIEYFKKGRDLKCINGKFYDINGANTESQIKRQIQNDISKYILSNLAQKTENLYKAIEIDTSTDNFTPSTTEIHVLNGVLKTNGEFIQKKCFCLNRLQIEYNPTAPEPKVFLHCLHDMLDEDDILTLQEYMGYLLIPSTVAQKSLSVIGEGGEGKTTVIGEPLKQIFGNSMTDGNISEISNNRFIGADLENKLLFFEDELDSRKLEDTSMIKKIITNQGKLSVEQKFKNRYSALLYTRFLMLGNKCLEALYDTSNGFFRRQIVIKTKSKPDDRKDETDLKNELNKEVQGIFNWYFEGLQRLMKNKFHFTISAQSEELVNKLKSQAFNFIGFLEDRATYGKQYAVSTRDIQFSYENWCRDNGEVPLAKRTIATYLSNHTKELKISPTKVINEEGKQVRGYKGIKITPLNKPTV